MHKHGNQISKLSEKIVGFFKKPKIRLSDSGIFDPYLPINSLKPLKGESMEWLSHATLEEGEQLPKKFNSYFYFKAGVCLVLVVVVFRLVYLQISNSQNYVTQAKGNSQTIQHNPAPRGLIYDRNGVPLVTNTPSFSVIFQVAQFPKKPADQESYINRLSAIVGVPTADLTKKINNSLKQNEAVIVSGLSRDKGMALQLRLHDFPGIYLQQVPVRQYGNIPDIGHILGYVGLASDGDLASNQTLLANSIVGKAGIEAQYDSLLQGQSSVETLEVDSHGQIVRSIGNTPAIPGDSLYLTLDSSLQNVAVTALQNSITANKATSGAAVVMDVNTGGVLAMASVPTYDANIFSEPDKQSQLTSLFSDPQAPLLNRATSGQYPSGSTIKPIYAVAALDENVITKDTKIDTSAGKISVGQWTFSDWTTHGVTNVVQAIAQSNDIFFYEIGGGYKNIGGLGIDRLDKWLDRFGFGRPTGIDLPGETNGNVPSPSWLKSVRNESWYVGDTYNVSIGQGDLLVTPLQLTRAISAIANGGKLITPHLLKSTQDNNNNIIDTKTQVDNSQIADKASIETVRQGMLATVQAGGSAHSILGSLPFTTGAKTGTAQTNQTLTSTHAWFTMFAPYDNPQIAISVIVEGGGEGYDVAGPVARAITQSYFNLPITPIVAAVPSH